MGAYQSNRRGEKEASPELLHSLGMKEFKKRRLTRRPPRRTNVSPLRTTAFVSRSISRETLVRQCDLVLGEFYRLIRSGHTGRARYSQLTSSLFFTCGGYFLPKTSEATLEDIRRERMTFSDHLRYVLTDRDVSDALRIGGNASGTICIGDVHAFIHLVFMSYNQPFSVSEVTDEMVRDLMSRVMEFEGYDIFGPEGTPLGEVLNLLIREQIFLDALADTAQGFTAFSRHIVRGISLAYANDWPEYSRRCKKMVELMEFCQWERHEEVGGPDYALHHLVGFVPYRNEARSLLRVHYDLIGRVRARCPDTTIPVPILLAVGRFCAPALGIPPERTHPSRFPRLWELLKILYVAQGRQPGCAEDTHKLMRKSVLHRDLHTREVEIYQSYRCYIQRQNYTWRFSETARGCH